jgi:hypothetical protein
MNVSTTLTTRAALRTDSGRPSYKSRVTVVATFALAIAFALVDAPVATASTNNYIPSASAAAHRDVDWPGPGCDPWGCWPGWPGNQRGDRPGRPQPRYERSTHPAPSVLTGAASSDFASPPNHNGPLCPGFPGTCPPGSTKLQQLA